MAFIAPIVGILGSAMSALGAISGAQAQSNAANYNRQIQEQQAEQSRQAGAAGAEKSVREGRRALGLQRAAIGESGFGYSGSLYDLTQQSAAGVDLDTLSIAAQAEAEARTHMNQAQLYRMEAENAKKAGYIGGASALLGGFGKLATGYGRTGGYGGGGSGSLWV